MKNEKGHIIKNLYYLPICTSALVFCKRETARTGPCIFSINKLPIGTQRHLSVSCKNSRSNQRALIKGDAFVTHISSLLISSAELLIYNLDSERACARIQQEIRERSTHLNPRVYARAPSLSLSAITLRFNGEKIVAAMMFFAIFCLAKRIVFTWWFFFYMCCRVQHDQIRQWFRPSWKGAIRYPSDLQADRLSRCGN